MGKMNKMSILAVKCKNISKGNIKCYSILMDLFDAGREDILNEILRLMNLDYKALTPEQIVNTYTDCKGKEGFLKRCNKMFNKSTLRKEYSEYNYEQHLKEYAAGERVDHPDGTRLELGGKEIAYD